MVKPKDPRELAETLLNRSTCSVMVAACIEDKFGIHSWGWNSAGYSGYGMHAEAHAIVRANKPRLYGSTIYVASIRKRNGNPVIAKPCVNCQKLLDKYMITVKYRDKDGLWK